MAADENSPVPETIAAIIVSRIAEDLRSTAGVREGWKRLPEDVRKRIVGEWLEHAKATVAKYTRETQRGECDATDLR